MRQTGKKEIYLGNVMGQVENGGLMIMLMIL